MSKTLSIAIIRGRARGGGSEFAMACDVRFASREKAIFGQPEVGFGLIPGGGALERLPLLVGRSRAIEIVLGADDFDADMAERYGWINRAIPDADLDGFVANFVRRVLSFDSQALSTAKAILNHTGLPNEVQLRSTQASFGATLRWPEALQRMAKSRERGLGMVTSMISAIRAEGPLVISRIRSESRIASSTSWVTMNTVLRVVFHIWINSS